MKNPKIIPEYLETYSKDYLVEHIKLLYKEIFELEQEIDRLDPPYYENL